MRHLESYLDASEILRLFEEKFGTGVWHCDAEGRMQWSRGFYGLLGLDPHTVAPSYAEIERRIHPEDRRPQRDPRGFAFDRSLLDGEFRIIRPNRALRWLRIQSETFLNSAGEPECVVGVAIDITEHRRSLQPLKMDADRYAALTQVAGGLLWVGSRDGRITALLNAENQPDAHRFFGKGWLDLLPEEERETALRIWAAAAETGQPYDVEHRLRQSDGSYRWYHCRAVPVPDADGGIREWLGISTDVHEGRLSAQHVSTSRLTGAQLRAARGMLNWSVKQLAARTGISAAVIRRLEEQNGLLRLPDETLTSLRDTLSSAGIEFIFGAGKPGVRPR
ncbi:PAS domain-containing protein [Bradyrhizobium vignae]|uniref:histidine kinase n=1 Tax=Bradyrhizobium vignae TaxID=1549949 RepID=A0A2U3QCK4_9BRAD|nr:PAS domain-containing protein [Bradyrhizobium vignae]SPP99161.1 putative PAS/PAC sensor hybrid histidine kinase [Bradyrhizobium vignae]